ncbi:MAG: ATP-dependent DNA helicase RecG [Pelotomaculum sp. PtaB.Bin104]|nr:MAG: ATP-dependent DNA helicase RecG [Pelotomaculum sp. PtaB.Bin104]
MDKDFLKKSVQYIRSVGPRRAATLQKAGIFTVRDLLYNFPSRYEDRTQIRTAGACVNGETAVLRGTVLTTKEIRSKRGLIVSKVALQDGLEIFDAVWFNQTFVKKNLLPGTKIIITGKVEKEFGRTQVTVEDYEIDDGRDILSFARLVPVYPLSGQLTQRFLRAIVKNALEDLNSPGEFLPGLIFEKFQLPSIEKALSDIHFPENSADAERAKKRFIFEELFLFQLALAMRQKELRSREKLYMYVKEGDISTAYVESLPYRLTEDQLKVCTEISRDFESPAPMHRLLQGDVGAGKTVVSTIALLRAVESGLQGALMAPTEILAEQHYLGMKADLNRIGVKVALLTGSIRKKERENILERVINGEIDILVGTQALIQDKVHFKRLGLIVVDEQHRFGVRQRATLQYKSNSPDTLVMTATPIPRTLALTLYGDLDVSVITQLPPGRQPVKTYSVTPGALARVYGLVKEQVRLGRQAFIVCPLVEESEKIDLQAASELAEELAGGEFKCWRVGLLHGRLHPDEKEAVMTSFRRCEIDILVSTTVIEVGVDVPNATVMVILDADRFGLAQLHQLRGRVGRGAQQSHCILVASPKTVEGRARLKAMTRTTDGFELAEEDLRLRGPGEFHGTRQSGLPEFKVADLLRDWRALQLAREEALAWVREDPQLRKPERRLLLEEVKARFYNAISYIDVG